MWRRTDLPTHHIHDIHIHREREREICIKTVKYVKENTITNRTSDLCVFFTLSENICVNVLFRSFLFLGSKLIVLEELLEVFKKLSGMTEKHKRLQV